MIYSISSFGPPRILSPPLSHCRFARRLSGLLTRRAYISNRRLINSTERLAHRFFLSGWTTQFQRTHMRPQNLLRLLTDKNLARRLWIIFLFATWSAWNTKQHSYFRHKEILYRLRFQRVFSAELCTDNFEFLCNLVYKRSKWLHMYTVSRKRRWCGIL